jgi:hypothetical protein
MSLFIDLGCGLWLSVGGRSQEAILEGGTVMFPSGVADMTKWLLVWVVSSLDRHVGFHWLFVSCHQVVLAPVW